MWLFNKILKSIFKYTNVMGTASTSLSNAN